MMPVTVSSLKLSNPHQAHSLDTGLPSENMPAPMSEPLLATVYHRHVNSATAFYVALKLVT